MCRWAWSASSGSTNRKAGNILVRQCMIQPGEVVIVVERGKDVSQPRRSTRRVRRNPGANTVLPPPIVDLRWGVPGVEGELLGDVFDGGSITCASVR